MKFRTYVSINYPNIIKNSQHRILKYAKIRLFETVNTKNHEKQFFIQNFKTFDKLYYESNDASIIKIG